MPKIIEKFQTDKYIVYELTRKQVKTQYRDSSLGFLWTILNPLLNMCVMWLVFTGIFGRSDPYYALYLLTGNILFSALRNSTMQSLNSLVGNRGLLLKTKVDPKLFPLSNIFTSVVNFSFSLLAIIPFMIWLSISQGVNLFSYRLIFIVAMIPAFVLFEYGLGLLLSCVFVFFRDLKHLYSVFITLWTYLTPIFYKPTQILKNSPWVFEIIKLNPMYHFISYFRDCIYRGVIGVDALDNQIGSFVMNYSTLGIIYVCGIASLIVGVAVFKLLKTKIITRI